MVERGHDIRRAQDVRGVDESERERIGIMAVQELDAGEAAVEESVRERVVDFEPSYP